MLSRTAHLLSTRDGGGAAASSWFGRSSTTDSLWGCTKTFIAGLFIVAGVNFVCRGNVMGYCDDESQLVAPLLQLRSATNPPPPEGYGFAGDDSSGSRR